MRYSKRREREKEKEKGGKERKEYIEIIVQTSSHRAYLTRERRKTNVNRARQREKESKKRQCV